MSEGLTSLYSWALPLKITLFLPIDPVEPLTPLAVKTVRRDYEHHDQVVDHHDDSSHLLKGLCAARKDCESFEASVLAPPGQQIHYNDNLMTTTRMMVVVLVM